MSALRRFLVDFDAIPPAGPPPGSAPPHAALPAAVRPLFGDGPEPEAAADDRTGEEAAAADAVAVGVAEALAEAEAVHAAALAEAVARHTAEIALARERWAAEEGTALADRFRAAVVALGDAIGDAAAAALEPLLGEAARRVAVDGLRAAIADLVLAGTDGSIAVSGPVDLLDALRAALDASGIGAGTLVLTAADTVDVVVTADNSRIETRLAAWAGALGRRTAGGAAAGTDGAADAAGEEAA